MGKLSTSYGWDGKRVGRTHVFAVVCNQFAAALIFM